MIRLSNTGTWIAILVILLTLSGINCKYSSTSTSDSRGDTKAPLAAITEPLDGFVTDLIKLMVRGTTTDKNNVASVAIVGCRDGATPVEGSMCFPQMVYGGHLLASNTIKPKQATSLSGDFDTWEAQLILIGEPGDINDFTIRVATMDDHGNFSLSSDFVEVQLDLTNPDNTSPDLTIVTPLEGHEIGVPFAFVTGTGWDSSGFAQIVIDPGGVPAMIQGLAEVYWSAPVNLDPGLNTITVTAYDTQGNVSVRQVQVNQSLTDNMSLVNTPAAVTLGYNGGTAAEAPEHTVLLNNYYMDQYEVTNADYKMCYDAGWCPFIPPGLDWNEDYHALGILVPLDEHEQLPVVNVPWDFGFFYCMWMGKRLPTEAEWERAARAGDGPNNLPDGRLYPWGGLGDCVQPDCSDQANFLGTNMSPVDVGNYPPNPLGIYDLCGNVMEWVWDIYKDDFYTDLFAIEPAPAPVFDDPTQATCNNLPPGWEFLCHVNRGGAYTTNEQISRSTFRNYYDDPGMGPIPPSGLDMVIGFRCAMD